MKNMRNYEDFVSAVSYKHVMVLNLLITVFFFIFELGWVGCLIGAMNENCNADMAIVGSNPDLPFKGFRLKCHQISSLIKTWFKL